MRRRPSKRKQARPAGPTGFRSPGVTTTLARSLTALMRKAISGYVESMRTESADAVVIGAGPNGLVAANALVDAGWDVVVLEANSVFGGAVRSAEVTAPGFVTDLFSAFYPLAAASPVIRGLGLADYGLTWRRAPAVLAHVLEDGRAAVLGQSVEETAHSLEAFAAGDGDVRRLADERFGGEGAALLLTGNAMPTYVRQAARQVPARRRDAEAQLGAPASGALARTTGSRCRDRSSRCGCGWLRRLRRRSLRRATAG